ncbi:hypothetical protein E4P42_16315 [Mycobacterium sp. PS03-16]|nr:hypothetical protein E4P42_16315 [Mycobacterium sp. PS03-16]
MLAEALGDGGNRHGETGSRRGGIGLRGHEVILLLCRRSDRGQAGTAAPQERIAARARSAAGRTTETTRDAAQIDCAALGEQLLEAGGHADSLPNEGDQANSGSSTDRRSATLGTPEVR